MSQAGDVHSTAVPAIPAGTVVSTPPKTKPKRPSTAKQRKLVEATIERLVDLLDEITSDPDLEPECEDEGAQCEDEGAAERQDDEPSLGSLDRMSIRPGGQKVVAAGMETKTSNSTPPTTSQAVANTGHASRRAASLVPISLIIGTKHGQGDILMAAPLTVELHPIWAGGRSGYRYDVTLNGETIVHRSADPETDSARALLARGIKGIVTVLDGKTNKPRSRINIERSAKLRGTEESRGGLRFRKYSETPDNSPHTGESPDSPERIPEAGFPQKKVQKAA
jgi:hypothetical protein